ncbi:MAG: metal ABC transporter solute-binding protein, Zn/Mn family, partial [Verrucomicrobiales bacterium]
MSRFCRSAVITLGACTAVWLSACDRSEPGGDGQLSIVATTGMVGDMVKAIGGDRVEIRELMGAGIDPHSFK